MGQKNPGKGARQVEIRNQEHLDEHDEPFVRLAAEVLADALAGALGNLLELCTPGPTREHVALVGTLGLGVGTPRSDLDIVCSVDDPATFAREARRLLGTESQFRVRVGPMQGRATAVVSFQPRLARNGHPLIELFAQPGELDTQYGLRHYDVERRLLARNPAARAGVRGLKAQGLSTEAAFVEVFEIHGPGNEFEKLYALGAQGQDEDQEPNT